MTCFFGHRFCIDSIENPRWGTTAASPFGGRNVGGLPCSWGRNKRTGEGASGRKLSRARQCYDWSEHVPAFMNRRRRSSGMALPNLRDAAGRLERACASIYDSPAARIGNGFAKPERCRRRQVSNKGVAASAFRRALHSGMALPNLFGASDGPVARHHGRQGLSTAAVDVRLSHPGHV